MERIAVLGLSLSETDVASLERFSGPVAAGGDALCLELADALAASELAVLRTCNRLELCYARESGHQPGPEDAGEVVGALRLPPELASALHFHGGRQAVRHIFRVASSLDSLVVGEDQILAQVRAAFGHAEGLGLAGRLLSVVFEHAFQVGKQVRTETELGRRPLSVVGVGVAALAEHFGERRPRVAVVGAGEMGQLAARALAGVGLGPAVVVNRSPEAAARLASAHGATPLALDRFRAGAEPVDALVSATSAPGTILDRRALAALAGRTPLGGALFAVDLAMPRDLEPAPESAVELIDLEALRERARDNRLQRRLAAREAETLVERKVDVVARRFSQRRVAAAISDLHLESNAVFERELALLARGPLGALEPCAREAIERWARVTFGRVSHVPISALKQLAEELGGGAPNGEEDE